MKTFGSSLASTARTSMSYGRCPPIAQPEKMVSGDWLTVTKAHFYGGLANMVVLFA